MKQCRLIKKFIISGLYYKKNRKSFENLKIIPTRQQYFNHTFVAGGDTRSGSKIWVECGKVEDS
jgi:hypothetical protein